MVKKKNLLENYNVKIKIFSLLLSYFRQNSDLEMIWGRFQIKLIRSRNTEEKLYFHVTVFREVSCFSA